MLLYSIYHVSIYKNTCQNLIDQIFQCQQNKKRYYIIWDDIILLFKSKQLNQEDWSNDYSSATWGSISSQLHMSWVQTLTFLLAPIESYTFW